VLADLPVNRKTVRVPQGPPYLRGFIIRHFLHI
jgi:hypothetical protein